MCVCVLPEKVRATCGLVSAEAGLGFCEEEEEHSFIILRDFCFLHTAELLNDEPLWKLLLLNLCVTVASVSALHHHLYYYRPKGHSSSSMHP